MSEQRPPGINLQPLPHEGGRGEIGTRGNMLSRVAAGGIRRLRRERVSHTTDTLAVPLVPDTETSDTTDDPAVQVQSVAEDTMPFTLGENSSTPMSMDERVDTSNPVAFAASQIHYLQQAFAGKKVSRYMEVHAINNEPVLFIAPRQLRAYGASEEGNHSLVDELRVYDGHNYPRIMDFVDNPSHNLTTGTIVAKGKVKVDEEGNTGLVIKHPRGPKIGKAYTWLSGIVQNKEMLGINSSVTLQERYDAPSVELHPTDDEGIKVLVSESTYSSEEFPKGTLFFEGQPLIFNGVMKNITVHEEVGFINQSGQFQRENRIDLFTALARTRLHAPIYKLVHMDDDPRGLMQVSWRGRDMKVGMRYQIDATNSAGSINIFFDADYGEKGKELQDLLAANMGRHMADYWGRDDKDLAVTVTVSKDGPAEEYGLKIKGRQRVY